MTITDIGTVVLAVVALLGFITAIIRAFFRRGADEREFVVALRENTKATNSLTGDFRSFRDYVTDKLHAHELEIERLKYQPPPIHVHTQVEAPVDDRTPAYRNAGPPG